MDKQYLYCFKAFLILLVVMYVPGLFYFPFFYDGYLNYFNYNGGLYFYFFIISLFFVFVTFLCFLAVGKIPYIKVRPLSSRVVFFILAVIVFIFFIFSVYFFLNFTSSFRHKNRLSDAGVLVAFLFFIKPIVYYIVALMLIHVLNGFKLGSWSRFLLFLILISTILFLNSSLQFIIVPIILIMLFFPRLLFVELNRLGFKYVLLIVFLVPVSCFLVVFIGVGNKVGYNFLLSDEGVYYLKNFGSVLFPRMSTSLFSSVVIFENIISGYYFSDKVVDGILATLTNRFSLFLPLDKFDADLINTVNRLNYLEVFNSHADRAGASPGIISSVFFFPLFPLSFFIIPMYVAIIFKSLRYHMKKEIRVNLISMMILPYLLISLFEAPINILYILDPIFFLFISIVFLGRFINSHVVFSK